MLYASSQRIGCYVETLARLRPDPAVISGLQAIDGDEPLEPVGVVPSSSLARRSIGTAFVSGDFADVGRARSLAWLRTGFAAETLQFGLADLDAAAIRLRVPRRLTQLMSRAIYECSQEGTRQFSGIAYFSRFVDEFRNWAIFEPKEINVGETLAIDPEDRDFVTALGILGLSLEGTSPTGA